MKKQSKKQVENINNSNDKLLLSDVSKQRELLITWNNWMKNEYPDYIPIPLYIIDRFLSN